MLRIARRLQISLAEAPTPHSRCLGPDHHEVECLARSFPSRRFAALRPRAAGLTALTGPRSSDVEHLRDGRAVLKSGKQHHRLSTRTANRALAQALAEKHHIAVLEGRAGLRQAKPVLLSVHI